MEAENAVARSKARAAKDAVEAAKKRLAAEAAKAAEAKKKADAADKIKTDAAEAAAKIEKDALAARKAADAKSAAVDKLKALEAAAAKLKTDTAAKAAERLRKASISPANQKLAMQLDIPPKSLPETSFTSLRPYLTKLNLWSANYVTDASSLLLTIQKKCKKSAKCALTTLNEPSYKKIWLTIGSNQTRAACRSAITKRAECAKASAIKLRKLKLILAGVAGSRFQYLIDSKACKNDDDDCQQNTLITYNKRCSKALCPKTSDCAQECKNALGNPPPKEDQKIGLFGGESDLAKRGLELVTHSYLLVSCFSGFGTDSVKSLNEYVVNQPTMALCENQIPGASKYGLDALDKAVTEANAKKE